jgi:hypothetical protein
VTTTTEAKPKPPAPIKPRTLRRARDGYGYVTTDGRYSVHPAYAHAKLGGRANRVEHWVVTDHRPKDPKRGNFTVPDLERFRQLYCAPGGKVPWVALDMDDGVVRAEATRAELVNWLCRHHDGKVISRRTIYPGYYEYRIGYTEDDSTLMWVGRADILASHDGWNVEQEPWYPYPDEPHETGPRADATEDKRWSDG